MRSHPALLESEDFAPWGGGGAVACYGKRVDEASPLAEGEGAEVTPYEALPTGGGVAASPSRRRHCVTL